MIHIDEKKIAKVLSNLIVNAINVTPEGGVVSVTSTVMPVHEVPGKDILRIAVKDAGAKDVKVVFYSFIYFLITNSSVPFKLDL